MEEGLKITVAYERGKCSVCSEITQVRLLMGNGKLCKICRRCAGGVGDKPASEILSEYGGKEH